MEIRGRQTANVKNFLTMSFYSHSENVGMARVVAAAFAAQADFTLNTLEEIKVAVSEAVTNAIVHGYAARDGMVEMTISLYDDRLEFVVADHGCGIADIAQARQPSFSTDPERMGLGFAFMESFMDKLEVTSVVGQGTVVTMCKYLPAAAASR